MADKSLVHGPLEFLFTIDEESGLTGAAGLEPGFIESRTLINLDSEDEGELYVGCSGGRQTLATWKATFEAAPKGAVTGVLRVSGLNGGHSGLEIDKGRGNAVKLANRALLAIAGCGVRIASLDGGDKQNAIPREAEAIVYVPAKKWDEAVAAGSAFEAVAKAEVPTVEPGLTIAREAANGVKRGKVMTRVLQQKLQRTIAALPHGVLKMSADIPGLVETSTNLAAIKTTPKSVVITTSQRSSVESEKDDACHTVSTIIALGGATVAAADGYPGWKPNLDSAILKLAKSTYQSMFGKEPEIKAIHAGLECGIIGERFPGMDMVSFGPTMKEVHSPSERLYIDTVPRFYEFVLGILKAAP